MITQEVSWEVALPELLEELSSVQHDWLEVLLEKQRLLLNPATESNLADLQTREQELLIRLQNCHDQRTGLLKSAEREGESKETLRKLVGKLPGQEQRRDVEQRLDQTEKQMTLLRQRNLSNWVLHQRAMIHLSQVLEIIATGGRLQPTYKMEALAESGPTGGLVDQEV
jgi:flagellar biosynthesis/type III secretory pathway chaperone